MLSLFFTAPGQVQVFDRHNSLISYFNWLNLLGLCCLIKVEVALDQTLGSNTINSFIRMSLYCCWCHIYIYIYIYISH